MKVVITGTRGGWPTVESDLDRFVREHGRPDQLILGGARGVDTQAENWAIKHGIPYVVHRADWDQHGKAAGALRNQVMVDDADEADWCLAFPSELSRGTYDCLRRARKKGLRCLVFGHGGGFGAEH